jgi:hypothetical protein
MLDNLLRILSSGKKEDSRCNSIRVIAVFLSLSAIMFSGCDEIEIGRVKKQVYKRTAHRYTQKYIEVNGRRYLNPHYHSSNKPYCPDGRCPNMYGRSSANLPYGQPPFDLPSSDREENWGGGSCYHASMVMCLRWQGLNDIAAEWRKRYSGGASIGDIIRICESFGLDYAYTSSNRNVAFLEWCSRTRRGAAIEYYKNHAICFCGFKKDSTGTEIAVLLDNNRPRSYIHVPKNQFINNWIGYGSRAITPVYSPAPPVVYLFK